MTPDLAAATACFRVIARAITRPTFSVIARPTFAVIARPTFAVIARPAFASAIGVTPARPARVRAILPARGVSPPSIIATRPATLATHRFGRFHAGHPAISARPARTPSSARHHGPALAAHWRLVRQRHVQHVPN